MPKNVMTEATISVAEIKEKVDKYFDYMRTKVPDGDIYVSNVVAQKDLDAIFLNSNYYGVRIMLVKDIDQSQEQEGIGMFIIPVIQVPEVLDWNINAEYINQLSESDKVIYEFCPSKYCKLTTQKPLLP